MSVQGALSPNEIDTIFHEGIIGRIGCLGLEEGKIHITPVAYAYDGHFIYCYSADGAKVKMMRKNPKVCFEVDMIEDISNWRSVAAWGVFEPLEGSEALKALELLSSRIRTIAKSESETIDARTFVTRTGQFGLAYRIKVLESSGRFERCST
jgi:nitroimidazol reductase NimA-like FMN-containing flavoprotein (pyridoxamine 5'-phosphate oxidase superfamily)